MRSRRSVAGGCPAVAVQAAAAVAAAAAAAVVVPGRRRRRRPPAVTTTGHPVPSTCSSGTNRNWTS